MQRFVQRAIVEQRPLRYEQRGPAAWASSQGRGLSLRTRKISLERTHVAPVVVAYLVAM